MGGKDVFVVKYDASGTKQWTRQFSLQVFPKSHNTTPPVRWFHLKTKVKKFRLILEVALMGIGTG